MEVNPPARQPPKEAEISVYQVPPPIYPPHIVSATCEMVDANLAGVISGGNMDPFLHGCVVSEMEGQAVKRHPSTPFHA